MRGDPTPNREREDFFRRKMIRFGSDLGRKRLKALGFASQEELAELHIAKLYGHLPETKCEGDGHLCDKR